MKHGLALIISGIALLSIGCGNPSLKSSDGKDPNEGVIKILTFNIRYGTADDGIYQWQYRRNSLFTQINEHAPDIMGLQEALDFQITHILRNTRHYDYIGVGRDDGKSKGEFCPILYRTDRFRVADSGTFWFSNSPWVVASTHWGNPTTRICTWARLIEKKTGTGFYVFNLHIDHQSQPSRAKSTELLARKVDAREFKEPFVVTGDFNAQADSPELMYLFGKTKLKTPQLMVDVLAAINPQAAQSGTFHNFSGKTDGGRIDFILTAPETPILDAQIDQRAFAGRYPSDHFPVIAKLKLL